MLLITPARITAGLLNKTMYAAIQSLRVSRLDGLHAFRILIDERAIVHVCVSRVNGSWPSECVNGILADEPASVRVIVSIAD